MNLQILNSILGRYTTHGEAVVVSCFFNPMRSPYRLKAFREFYKTIRHMNHRIVECVIGDAEPQLEQGENIARVYTPNLLWHKEALLNGIVKTLPAKFKFVFWVDADVVFTNQHWLTEGVSALRSNNIIQPFEYCVHLGRDELKPSFSMGDVRSTVSDPAQRFKTVWKSFCSNFGNSFGRSENYDQHGHVGFAWGARREVLEACPLYDKALIGGADHIVAHAAAGQVPHPCITKAFKDDLKPVLEWSHRFSRIVNRRVGYVKGDLYHIWHGDIEKREYLRRVKEFTGTAKGITKKDKNGLYVNHAGDDAYMRRYFRSREVHHDSGDDGFVSSMMLGYMTDDPLVSGMLGGNFTGAIVGSMMRDNSERHHAPAEVHASIPDMPYVEPPSTLPDNPLIETPANQGIDSPAVNCENFS